MLLALGSLRVDVATRTVVVGRLGGPATAGSAAVDVAPSLVAAGADALEVTAVATVRALVDQLAAPVVLAAADPAEAVAGLDAGAAGVVVRQAWSSDVLPVVRDAGATAFVPPVCLAAAAGAGLRPMEVVVDVGGDGGDRVAPARRWPGSHLGLSVPSGCPAAGPVALAVARGCRVVCVSDVRGARRAADVVAAILRAGGDEGAAHR